MLKSIKTKLYFYFGLSIIITSMVSSGFFFMRYRIELDGGINEKLSTGATIALNGIDLSRLAFAYDPGFRESGDYNDVLKYLKRTERAFGFKYIYNVIKKDGDYIFIYDTGNYESTSGEADTFLTTYADRPAALDGAWNTGDSKMEEYTDQWGSFRSVFLPVKDGNGKVVTVIGVDYGIDRVKSTMRKSYMVFGAMLIFIAVVTVFAVYRLRNAIITPITRIMGEVTVISENADLTCRTSVSGTNEVGLLAISFNKFIEKSAGIIHEIDEISQRLASSSEDFASISTNLAQTKSDITREAAYTAETITGLINRITTLSGEQLDLFVSLKKLIENLYNGIQTVNTQAGKTLGLSSEVAGNAIRGGESISTMNASMDSVMKSSSDMMGIIEIINDISDRINLLSLNAAIEAARAGEAGRGFAVVSEEISKLADQTAESTKNIGTLIKANSAEISMEISNLEAATSILNLVIKGVEQMKNETTEINFIAAEQLETAGMLRENSANIFTRAAEIKEIAASQKNELDAISASLSTIDRYTASVTSGAENISSSSEDIAAMAEELRGKVSLFKV